MVSALRVFFVCGVGLSAVLTGYAAREGNPLGAASAAASVVLLAMGYRYESAELARLRDDGPVTARVLADLRFQYHAGDEEFQRTVFRVEWPSAVTLGWYDGVLTLSQPWGENRPPECMEGGTDLIEMRCVTAGHLRRWVAALEGGE